MAQRIRALLYPRGSAYLDDISFEVRACTGSILRSRTSEFHGYPFSIHGYYEWRLLTCALATISEEQSIIEIGANIGTETVSFIDIVSSEGRVIAFEPFPDHVKSLEKLKLLNSAKNLTIEPYALSDIEETLKFSVPFDGHSSGVGHLLRNNMDTSSKQIDIECKTLDSYIGEKINVGMVFMDAEGSELNIINGGKNFIEKHMPIIILESAPKLLLRSGHTVKDLVSEIKLFGYEIYYMGSLSLKLMTSKEMNRKQNLVCIPKEKNNLISLINMKIKIVGFLPMLNWLNPLKNIKN